MGIAYAVAAIDNSAEEVAWVVGDQPIWKSDIEEAYQSMLYEKAPINGDPYCVIPEQLAIEKLYLHQADLDTIEVSEGMIMQQVEQTINNYVAQLGSQDKVEVEYILYGKSNVESVKAAYNDIYRLVRVLL